MWMHFGINPSLGKIRSTIWFRSTKDVQIFNDMIGVAMCHKRNGYPGGYDSPKKFVFNNNSCRNELQNSA